VRKNKRRLVENRIVRAQKSLHSKERGVYFAESLRGFFEGAFASFAVKSMKGAGRSGVDALFQRNSEEKNADKEGRNA